MSAQKLKSIGEFCENNGVSKATFYNLEKIGRAPDVIRLGGRILISPEAEEAWRRRMEAEPIVGGVRGAAARARAGEVANQQKAA